MAIITRIIQNTTSTQTNITLLVPGYDTEKPTVVIAYGEILDLFTVLTADQLEAIQPTLAQYVSLGQLAVTATVDTATFNPVGNNGAPSTVASVSLTAQGADIAPTTLFTPSVTGLYQVNAYGIVVTSDVGANNSTAVTISFNNDVGAQTFNPITMDLTTASITYSATQVIEAVSGVPVTYAVGPGDPYGAAIYNLYITVIKI
jgi:hypothetical protein